MDDKFERNTAGLHLNSHAFVSDGVEAWLSSPATTFTGFSALKILRKLVIHYGKSFVKGGNISMKSNLYKEAKELFFKYNCNPFLMTRAQNNADEKYHSFHVPNEQEELWRQEYQNNLIDEIRNEKNMQELVWKIDQLCDCIDQNNNLNVLNSLLEYLERNSIDYDSFSKILISETMINFVKKTTIIDSEGVKEIEKCKLYAYNLAQSIIADEISIDSGYYKLDYLEGILTPEKILARANSVIRAFD